MKINLFFFSNFGQMLTQIICMPYTGFLRDNFPCLANRSLMSGHHQTLPALFSYVRLSMCKCKFPDPDSGMLAILPGRRGLRVHKAK